MGKTPYGVPIIFMYTNFKMNLSTRKRLELRARQAHRVLVVEKDSVLLHFKVQMLHPPGRGVETAGVATTAGKELQTLHSHRTRSMKARRNCL